MTAIREQALLLGPRRSLVGIVTDGAVPGSDRPVVVILNSGIVHRVGANRMSVALARALAATGHTVLRFDLSGIGDSDPRPESLPPWEAGYADVREVLDSLESSRGTRRVILAGLCAGADLSLLCAQRDARVVGAALLDPFLPRTRRHWMHHYGRRMLRPESWLNVMRGRNPFGRALRARLAGDDAPVAQDPREKLARDPEVRAFLERAYQDALRRGTQLMAVVSGERSYYRAHLLDAFPAAPFGRQLRLEYFRRSDHLFTASGDSARLVRSVVDWTGTVSFPAGAP
jgi:pimeloyl-ACP methyl ester carboxylesterase